MTSKNYIKLFTMLLVIFILGACKKSFLNRPSEDSLTADTYYLTDDEVNMGTAALYNAVWYNYQYNTILNLGDIRAGNMQSNDRKAWYRFTVTSSDIYSIAPAWSSLFNVVSQANLVMYYVRKASSPVTDAVKTRAIAECKFMRGLAYYLLVLNWGPVPLITDNLSVLTDTTITRNDTTSVMEFAIRDLRYAAQNLPSTAFATGRLTKWSAEGMLAKVFYTRACYSRPAAGQRNQQWLDSAAYYAGDVCKNSGLSLVSNYSDLFLISNNNNKESLFAMQCMGNSSVSNVGNTIQAYYAYDPVITGTGDGWGAAHGASINLLKEYETNDTLRLNATFMTFGVRYPEILTDSSGGLCYKYASLYDTAQVNAYERKYRADPNGSYTHHDSINFDNPCNVKKYIVGRAEDNPSNTVNVMATGLNIYFLRLAEVYLTYAASLIPGTDTVTTDANAVTYFNLVRTRAGLDSRTVSLNNLLHEFRVEFAEEGNFWYHLMDYYYYDKDAMFAYILAQDKGSYIVKCAEGVSPRKLTYLHTSSKAEEHWPVSDETICLPYPESDVSLAPNLLKAPIPYDFTNYK
jgi:starch-binding outer membrane protein, SusD/RagB family